MNRDEIGRIYKMQDKYKIQDWRFIVEFQENNETRNE